MTLLDAHEFDEARARRRRNRIILVAVAVLIAGWVAYHMRHYSERRTADRFFAALANQNIEEAYAIWLQDPDWKQHPGKYSNYTFNDFYQDWGPSGEWGHITSHAVDCSYSTGSGVIVQATLNHRAEHAYVWVDKSDRTLHFSPNQIECGNWFGWFTE